LRERSQIGAGLLVAAEESRSKDGNARRGWLDGEASLVEVDDDQAVALISGRVGDHRDPFLEEGIGRNKATGLAVLARSVVPIVAEIGSDENKVGCGGFSEKILGQEVKVTSKPSFSRTMTKTCLMRWRRSSESFGAAIIRRGSVPSSAAKTKSRLSFLNIRSVS
jgi:hypothetical protein